MTESAGVTPGPRRPRPPGVAWAPRPGAWLLAVLGLWAACSPTDRVREGIAVDTLDGVVRVVNLASTPAASMRAATLSESPLRIGRVDGDGPDVFGEIAAMAVGPEREIYVADRVALEIRVFSAEGEFRRAFGRQGEGPGEFEAIDGLVVTPEGAVLVRDPRLGRITRFGPGGELEGSFRLERSFFIFSDGTTLWADSAGRVYDRISLAIGAGEPERTAVVVYAGDTATDTVVAVTHRPVRAFARQGERVVMGIAMPFSPQPLIAVSAGGLIASGLGDEYRISITDHLGDRLRLFAREIPPDPVEEAEKSAATARLSARVEEMAPGSTLDDLEFPDEKPSIVRLHADPAGGWWVGRYRGEADAEDPTAPFPTEYDVFDASGRMIGSVILPPFILFQVGSDFVAGVEIDDLGVHYAVVYDLVRGE